MSDPIPPTKQALREAFELSEVILRNIELDELPLAKIILKVSRFARLLNDFPYQKIMEYEAAGYPKFPDGFPREIWELAVLAGRKTREKDITGAIKEFVYWSSIESLEHEIASFEAAMAATRDPDVSVSSANPGQLVFPSIGNKYEREKLIKNVTRARERLSSRVAFIHSYVMRRHYELKFSGIADDIFSRIREKVDTAISAKVPDAVQKLTAVYENLQSDNYEDWSNAVHSCRRLLQDLADVIYPARADRPEIIKTVKGQKRTILLGRDNYINRLIAFLEDHSTSERFTDIVGSHLEFIGDRLDSIFKSTQKGSHTKIVSREEADRYVVYTYLITGDILSLL